MINRTRKLKLTYLASMVVCLSSVLYLPVGWVCFLAIAAWCLFALAREESVALKSGYKAVLQAVGSYVGANLMALAAFKLAGKYNRGGLFSGAGADDFGTLLLCLAAGGALLLGGTLWALVRLFKGWRALDRAEKIPF